MPVEVESSGQVSEFMRVMRRRWALIFIPFAIISSLGVAFAVIVPKKFVARTRVMVHEVPGAGSQSAKGQEQGKIATHLIRSPRRVQAVIVQDVGWPYQELSEEEREDMIKQVLGNLTVETPNMGLGVKQQVVTITYADTDRKRAYDFLIAVSQRWRNEVLEASRNAKVAEFTNLTNRKTQMEAREKAIGDQIAEIHRVNTIPPWTLDSRGERSLDPAFVHLDRLRLELGEVDVAIDDRLLRLAEDEKLYELMDDEVSFLETALALDLSKEILSNEEAIIQLRLEITRQGYKSEHRRYGQIQDEIREREEVIRLLHDNARGGVASVEQRLPNVKKLAAAEQLEKDRIAAARDQQRRETIVLEVANLDARTNELQSVYQQLETLMGERQRLHENLIVVGEDHNAMRRQIDILTSAAGNPFMILDEPKMPVRPTQPDPILIIVATCLVSLLLGTGLSILVEYSHSCFRSVNEITRVMFVPVLGTVNDIITRRDRRRVLVARLVLGGSTLAFVCIVGFMTWAWALRPDLLTDDVRQSIDAFRASFE